MKKCLDYYFSREYCTHPKSLKSKKLSYVIWFTINGRGLWRDVFKITTYSSRVYKLICFLAFSMHECIISASMWEWSLSKNFISIVLILGRWFTAKSIMLDMNLFLFCPPHVSEYVMIWSMFSGKLLKNWKMQVAISDAPRLPLVSSQKKQ